MLKFNSVGQHVISPELGLPRPLFKLRNIVLVTAITVTDTQHMCWVLYLLYLMHLTMTLRSWHCKRAHFAGENMQAQIGWDIGPRSLSYWVRTHTQVGRPGQRGLCHSFQLLWPMNLRCPSSLVHRPALGCETGINFWRYPLVINRLYLAPDCLFSCSTLGFC